MTFIGSIQYWIFTAVFIAGFVLEAWAFASCARRPAAAFAAAGKRTKRFWLLITGIALLIGFLSLPPYGPLGSVIFLALIAAGAAILYLVDVRPAVRGPRRGRKPPRGGW